MNAREKGRASAFPAFALGAFSFLLAVLVWPRNLEQVVSLHWRLGNLRPAAYGLQAALLLLAIACFVWREGINRRLAMIFPTRRRVVFALVAVLLALVLAAVTAEIALRILGLPFRDGPGKSETALAQFDPELGWLYIPNRTAVQRFGTDQREVTMHFGEMGTRVRSPGAHFDPAMPTALFVGCSFTMGHGVPYEEAFTGKLESMPGFPLQVVNLGVQGYGTDQALLLLERIMSRFNTRLVVYTYLGGHMQRNENEDRRLLMPESRFIGTKPLFDLRSDGSLYERARPARFADRSEWRVWSLWKLFYTQWGPVPRADLTRALIREMDRYVESHGARLLVVHWRLFPRHSSEEDGELRDLDVRVLDTGSLLPAEWRAWRIPGDGHPDARAHAYMAKLMAAEIGRMGWPSRKPD